MNNLADKPSMDKTIQIAVGVVVPLTILVVLIVTVLVIRSCRQSHENTPQITSATNQQRPRPLPHDNDSRSQETSLTTPEERGGEVREEHIYDDTV